MNRTFKPERQKISNPYNLKTTDPIITKFQQVVRTTSVPSWVVPRFPSTNPRWRQTPSLISAKCQYLRIGSKISAPNFTVRCTLPCADDHVTKNRNRKLIRVTSLNEHLKHKCVDLSNYCIYVNQIWYRTQMPHGQHTRIAKFT